MGREADATDDLGSAEPEDDHVGSKEEKIDNPCQKPASSTPPRSRTTAQGRRVLRAFQTGQGPQSSLPSRLGADVSRWSWPGYVAAAIADSSDSLGRKPRRCRDGNPKLTTTNSALEFCDACRQRDLTREPDGRVWDMGTGAFTLPRATLPAGIQENSSFSAGVAPGG